MENILIREDLDCYSLPTRIQVPQEFERCYDRLFFVHPEVSGSTEAYNYLVKLVDEKGNPLEVEVVVPVAALLFTQRVILKHLPGWDIVKRDLITDEEF